MTSTAKNNFQALCREQHWRCTPQRQVIYDFMSGNLSHPSVDAVWEYARTKIPAITRESVYRILNEFAHAGVLHRMDRIESAHYDSQTRAHGHLVCERCGKVQDFELTGVPPLPPGVPPAELHHLEVRYSWLCPECRNLER